MALPRLLKMPPLRALCHSHRHRARVALAGLAGCGTLAHLVVDGPAHAGWLGRPAGSVGPGRARRAGVAAPPGAATGAPTGLAGAGIGGAVAATAARAHLPPLAGALIALLALAAGLVAFLPPRVATAPVLGLIRAVLAAAGVAAVLCRLSLRVVTAEASRWLLALQHDVARSGSSLLVNGHLVIVDAPCSGVQMVWLGYFTACVVALYGANGSAIGKSRLGDRAFPHAAARREWAGAHRQCSAQHIAGGCGDLGLASAGLGA